MTDPRWTDAEVREAKLAAAGPLGAALSRIPLQYAAGILIRPRSPQDKSHELRTATATLVQANDLNLVVTCYHVLAVYQRLVREGADPVCQLGNTWLDPSESLIDQSSSLDVATFRISEEQRSEITTHPEIGCSFGLATLHPSEALAAGGPVSLGGYPEVWRETRDMEAVLPTFSLGTTFLSSVSARELKLQFDRKSWMQAIDVDGNENPRALSGMSGGPIVAETSTASGVRHFKIVGVCKEYNETIDLMVGIPMNLIDSSGQIIGPGYLP